MGSEANRLRKKWQDYGGLKATKAEHDFYSVFVDLFKDTEYELIKQPNKFEDLYVNVKLSETENKEIYHPESPISKHGIKPDCLIRNKVSGKEIYVELKRQDGWVEGKLRKAGRGNAHERLCKYFTPGLLKFLREKSGIISPNLPFWIVFQGDITRDPCRVREIRFWFDGNETNVFFWRNTKDSKALTTHFVNNILPLLE
ncbi:MAG: MunI family type II restriction endonuclease [Bacteroidales bacterium]|nr:MunI family type II restriction endonuclease [Bacteroidales bacterium]